MIEQGWKGDDGMFAVNVEVAALNPILHVALGPRRPTLDPRSTQLEGCAVARGAVREASAGPAALVVDRYLVTEVGQQPRRKPAGKPAAYDADVEPFGASMGLGPIPVGSQVQTRRMVAWIATSNASHANLGRIKGAVEESEAPHHAGDRVRVSPV